MGRSQKKPEQVLSERVTNVMHTLYPKIPFRVDIIADLPLPMAKRLLLKKFHGKWSKGHPDLVVYSGRGGYGGLFLELKATDTVPNTDHTRRQAWYHKELRKQGYKCMFCCGYEDCKKKIKKYMKLKRNKTND